MFFFYQGQLVAEGWFTTAGGLSANRIARWDGSSWQSLGSGTGTTYYELLTQENIGNGGVTLTITGDFLWGCWPTQRYKWMRVEEDQQYYWYDHQESCGHKEWPEDHKWWSLTSKNSDSKDHFVTYKIDGLGGPFYNDKTVWLLFLEDLPFSSSDKDYNDFVVEISAIPEPATAFLLIAGAAMLLRKR